MSDKPTHRLVKSPRVSSRYLSDYMVASEIRRRSIIRDCKFPKIAKVIQHEKAKAFISNSLASNSLNSEKLAAEGNRLHEMMADSNFERDVLDINGDFLLAYSEVFSMETFPKTAELLPPPPKFVPNLNGVDVNADLRFSVQRVTRTNRLRTGFGSIRYSKNKPLNPEIGAYQSAFLFGSRKLFDIQDETAPEEKLCLTLDCVTGDFIPAPTDSTRRFQNMEAACATIAERWDSIEPPEGAVF